MKGQTIKVRAKFKVESVREAAEEGLSDVSMTAVTSGSPENEEFFKYTPAGSLNLGLVNPETAKFFVPGEEYYLDFIPVNTEDN